MTNPPDYMTDAWYWNKSDEEPQYWVDSAYVSFAFADRENFENNLRFAVQEKASRKDLLHLLQLRRVMRRLLNV